MVAAGLVGATVRVGGGVGREVGDGGLDGVAVGRGVGDAMLAGVAIGTDVGDSAGAGEDVAVGVPVGGMDV